MPNPTDPRSPIIDPLPKSRPAMPWLGALASIALFLASLYVLYRISSEVKLVDVEDAFQDASQHQIWLAGCFTILSYCFLAGYDLLAMRQLGISVKTPIVVFASFLSYAISFTLGFPLFTAGTVRYWIYSSSGVTSSKVMSLTLIAGMTFILGMAVIVGFGLMWESEAMAAINQASAHVNQLMGMAIISGIVVYLVWAAAKRRHVRIKSFIIELPTVAVSLGQLALGAFDVCAGAAVLYVLLPDGHGIAFETFASIYAFAAILGIISHAPGGLGVFEATILLVLHSLPREGVIGALLLFRLCYYLVPFVVAVCLLGFYEVVMRVSRFRGRMIPSKDGH